MLSKKYWHNKVLRNVYVGRHNDCLAILKDCEDKGVSYPKEIFEEYKHIKLILANWDFNGY